MLRTKIRPPTARRQWVVRERLLERLRPEPEVRLTAVIAPAGSGKTTLLGSWQEAEAERRPVGWVSLDEGDSDPILLWSHVFESLRRVCPALETCRRPEQVGAARIIDAFLPDLVNGLGEQGDAALVLDDFHRVMAGSSRDSIAWLVEHAPPSFQLVVSTRTEPALRLAALRAHGELLELRANELKFNADEAELFLNDRLELELCRDLVERLVERTDGWATGLYLAAVSLRSTGDRGAFVERFGGSSRHVVDFLVDEVLEAHDVAQQTLMLRCSVLEQLSGPVCDALLGQHDSSEQLSELMRTNLFLRPLDDHGQWYRFHKLFRQLLRVELEHRDPGLALALHRRAYEWHRDHGSTDEAIGHALQADAFEEAGDLIAARWPEYANAGRHETVLGWLERFPAQVLEFNAVLLVVKAWVLSLCAEPKEAAEAMAAALRLEEIEQGPLPDGASSVEASLATLKATIASGDVGARVEHALRAAELEQPESPFWTNVCWSRGMGHFFRAEFAEAEHWFAEASRLAPLFGKWLIAASALAYRSFIAGEEGHQEQQAWLADRAIRLAREHRIETIDGEVSGALGASLAARGKVEEARSLCQESVVALRAQGRPLDLAYALIRHVQVLRALGDNDAAAAAVAEARATVDSCDDPAMLEAWLAALERRPRERSANGNSELSDRELTVLRALTGPLSERDIARELYLSHNTVHSHTRSVYRKLNVSSRAEAVRQARTLGLL